MLTPEAVAAATRRFKLACVVTFSVTNNTPSTDAVNDNAAEEYFTVASELQGGGGDDDFEC